MRIAEHLSETGRERFANCGTWLEMKADKDLKIVKLNRANFCTNRFCPMCAWRKSIKEAMRISVLMDYIEAEHDKVFIMVTLTAPNVSGEALVREINKYNKAFKEFARSAEIRAMNRGYIRKLEITYSEKRNDYHPHFHVVFAVDKQYFKRSGGTYITHERWRDLWREAMGDDSIKMLRVERLKKVGEEQIKNGEIRQSSAANEIAKYAAKDADYGHSQEVFDAFYMALKGRQIITHNGLFAASNKLYKAGELDSYIKADKTEYYWVLEYGWMGQVYDEKVRRKIKDGDLYDEGVKRGQKRNMSKRIRGPNARKSYG